MASSLPLIPLRPSLPPSRPPPLSPHRRLHRQNQWLGRGKRINATHGGLEVLYDDGYRNAGRLHDYLQAVGDLMEFDQGPIRWFCPVDGGPPIKNAPLLLFLPDNQVKMALDSIGDGSHPLRTLYKFSRNLSSPLPRILENGIHLSTIIKCAGLYRQSRKHDHISDYLPPTMMELEAANKSGRDLYQAISPVMFSTMQDGKIVRGLSGVPNDGPVLLVGNHMLMGLELIPLCTEFLKEKRIVLRGIGHQLLFQGKIESSSQECDFFDFVSIFGAVPVSDRYFYRLLSEKAFVLLYPGGSREALHRKVCWTFSF
ncbi:hypothetical protein COCNU_12G001880 [Cocos nucifera]|uniref:Acyltransferase n=1 Tax=Cocos nucifera TaxID=13894 RepID=A0A8K0IRI6_COCNU|nr:hypothetical protein COCNU_12G001880 [Cocos nucifera]